MKLIWDFYGPAAERTASHHRTHVAEFAQNAALSTRESGVEEFVEGHWLAWLVVESEDVAALRAALNPHRGLPA